jgi:paraquat-inducible protein B
MSRKANPKLIGAFVVGAIVLMVAGVMIFGGTRLFRQSETYVLFFEGSLKGLNVGASVTLKGVRVGSVTNVKVMLDPETLNFFTPVYVELLPDRIATVPVHGAEARREAMGEDATPDEVIDLFVQRGLRGQLTLQSLLTGQLMVALDFHPGSPVYLAGLDRELPEIPTIPSDMQQIAKALENLDLKGITDKVHKTLDGVERLATSPELQESIHSLNQTLKDFGVLAQNLNGRVQPLSSRLDETMQDLQSALASAERALEDARVLVRHVDDKVDPLAASLDGTLKGAQETLAEARNVLITADEEVLGETSGVRYQLTRTLAELREAARAIRELAQFLENRPDAIIRGRTRLGGNDAP